MGMHWFLPTFHGDISLERISAERTLLKAERLTLGEAKALAELRTKATKKKWAKPDAWGPIGTEGDAYRTAEITVDLEAPIAEVQKILAASLKPDRELVTAARFADGRLTETFPAEAIAPDAAAATTVAKPVRGCPAPDFERAEIRATRVLETFLTPTQIVDFRTYNRFIAIGSETGHRYMLTSRHARDSLANYQRSLFDLDEGRPYCVHDWTVPAAEELLALRLLLALPGHESYLRSIPDDGLD